MSKSYRRNPAGSRSTNCRTSGKICYSEINAKIALSNIRHQDKPGHTESSSYHCPYCNYWHLTSRTDKDYFRAKDEYLFKVRKIRNKNIPTLSHRQIMEILEETLTNNPYDMEIVNSYLEFRDKSWRVSTVSASVIRDVIVSSKGEDYWFLIKNKFNSSKNTAKA